eukprot:g5569.t1
MWASALQIGGCNHKLLDEVLMGERRFVADMHTLVEVFHWPLLRWFEQQQDAVRAGETSCPVSRADIDSVFSNVDELIAFSRRLLPALERARTARSKGLLVVFLQLATSFKVFDVYVAGWPKGMECVAKMEADPPLAMFIRACELQERCGGSRLRDLLALPLQRVTQYRLLVESTSENCPLHLAALHRELARSLTLPPAMSENVPSAIVSLERRPYSERLHCSGPTKMIGKTAPRRLRGVAPSLEAALPRPKIKEGRLTKVCRDGPRSVRFVLFSDELFHSTIEIATATAAKDDDGGLVRNGGMPEMQRRDDDKYYQPQHGRHRGLGSIPLSCSYVIDDFEAPLHASFVVVSAHVSFLLQADSVTEKNEWVAALKASMDCCPSLSSSHSGSNLSSDRGPVRLTRGNEKFTDSADVSVGTTAGSRGASSEAGSGYGDGGNRSGRDDRQESSTDGVTTAASSAGSSLSALTLASASRSSSAAASCSSSSALSASSASSASSLTSSSYDSVTPSASMTGGAESQERGGVRAGDDSAPTPAAAAAADDGGGIPAHETRSRQRPSMQQGPHIRVPTTRKTRASHILMKGRGKNKFGARGRGGGDVGGGGGAGCGWKKRRGPVVRLVSRRKNANNASSSNLAAASAGSSNAEHPCSGVGHSCSGVGGGRGSGSVSSASGGSYRSCKIGNGGGANGGRCKLQEVSFWVACGPTGKIVRWETLRLDAPTGDEAWSGDVGFRRALANSACFAEFRGLLRSRHASENLNFREAVVHYQSLCYENIKKLKPMLSAGTGARVASANTPLARSRSPAGVVDGGLADDGQGDRRGAATESGGRASTGATSCASSSSSSFTVDVAAAAAAAAATASARGIVNRFVKEGAPEQVNLSASTRETIISRQQQQQREVEAEAGPASASVELFAEAWDEVSKLLQRDAFAQFRHTEAFLRLKREWDEEPNGVLSASEFVLASLSGSVDSVASSSSAPRASNSLAMVALHPPQPQTPARPPGTEASLSVRNGVHQSSSIEKHIEAGRSVRNGTPYPSPKHSFSRVPAPPVLPPPPPSLPAPATALSARREESKSATPPRSYCSGGSPGAPPSTCSPATSSSSRASIRSRLLSGLADHEHQQYQQHKKQQDQTPMTITPSDISTAPRDRMFSIAAAVAESPPSASRTIQTPPAPQVINEPLSSSSREQAAVTKHARQPEKRATVVPGVKGWESIVSATATTRKSAEPKIPAGDDDVGDDEDAASFAWPWPSDAPRACSPVQGHAPPPPPQQQKRQQHCVMPPLPLGPSLRNISVTNPSAVLESSTALKGASAASSTTTTATGKDAVALGGANGVAESAKHFIGDMGVADELSITIPSPLSRRTPPLLLHGVDAAGDQLYVSREEQLSADAVAWAAAAAERGKLELREEEEEEQGEEDNEQEQGEEDSPSMSPPSAPPRLVNRYSTATAAAAAGAAAAAAAAAAKNQKVRNRSSSQVGLVRAAAGDSREARAARAYAAAAAARKARKQAAAAAAAAAMKPLQHREGINDESATTPLGERRRRDARSVRRSPRHNRVQLLLQAPPGTGLGVMLVEQNGTQAMVAGFRSLPDDNFDSVLCAGLRVGDVLVSVNGIGVRGDFELAKELMTHGQKDGELRLVVKRAQESPASRALSQRGERHFCS